MDFTRRESAWSFEKYCLVSLFLLMSAAPLFAESFTIYDGFENNTIDPRWHLMEQNGTVSPSTTVTHNGQQAVELASNGGSVNGGQRYVWLETTLVDATIDDVSVFFYDAEPGQETLYEQLQVFNAADPSFGFFIGVQDYDRDCYTLGSAPIGPNANCGQYPMSTTTNVPRTLGWHQFEMQFSATSVSFYIDNSLIFETAGRYDFDTVRLQVSGPFWRPNTKAWFDDVDIKATSNEPPVPTVPEPSTLLLFGTGLLATARRLRRHAGAALLLLALLYPAVARAESMWDFESLQDGEHLITQIPGVTFSHAVALTAGMSLNEFDFPPLSGATVLSDEDGPMRIDFEQPVDQVLGYFTYSAPLTLDAFGAGGALLATASSAFASNTALSGIPGSAPNELLQVAAANIAYVVFRGGMFGSSFTVDNVIVTPSSETPLPSVPEPGTLGLVTLGLASLTRSAWCVRRGWRAVGALALLAVPSLSFAAGPIGRPLAQPDVLFVGEPATVTITAAIDPDPRLVAPSVNVIQLNANNVATGVLGRLFDDGTHGDRLAGDGLFTGRFAFGADVVLTTHLAVTAAYAGQPQRTRSDPFTVGVFQHLTAQDVQTVIDVQEQATELFETAQTQMDKNLARNATVLFLRQQPSVAQAGISSDGTIWSTSVRGIGAIIPTYQPGSLGHIGRMAAPATPVRPPPPPDVTYPTSSRALVLSPFLSAPLTNDPSASIVASLSNIGMHVTWLPNAEVTVNVMKTLNQYGVIHIFSHGGVYGGEQGAVLTGESSDDWETHEDDVLAGRVIMLVQNGKRLLGVTPEFFRLYAGDGYPQSIVIVVACSVLGVDSAPDASMADAFLSNKAAAFFGYRNPVFSFFAALTSSALVDMLVDAKKPPEQRTTGVSFANLQKVADPIENDFHTHGTLELHGNHDAAIAILPRLTLAPFGEHTLTETPGPYAVQVIDGTGKVQAAPDQITVTIHREVISPCQGVIFPRTMMAVIAPGASEVVYANAGNVAGRDPGCNTLPIRTTFTIVSATMGQDGTEINLAMTLPGQLSLSIDR